MSNLSKYDPTNIEIDFSNPESLFDDSQKTLAGQEYNPGGNTEWLAHRVWSGIGSADKIHWSFPGSKKDGEEVHSEILPGPQHHFVAFMGLPLRAEYGFSLMEKEEGGNSSKTICRTTKLDWMLGENSRTIEGPMPLDFPINQIHKSKKEPDTLTNQLASKPHLKLWVLDLLWGDPAQPSGRIRSCQECVEAEDYYIGTREQFDAQNSNIPACKMNGAVTFVVFKLGILDVQPLMQGTGPVGIKWVDVKDANIRRQDGTLLDRPFILKLRGMGKIQHWPIGTDNYSRNVIRSGKEVYLPKEVYSWGDFFNYMHKNNQYRTLKNGSIGYLQGVACYIGKHPKTEFLQNYMPVFSPVELDNPTEALMLGLSTLQFERGLAAGTATPQPYTGGWPQIAGHDFAEAAVLPTAAAAATVSTTPNLQSTEGLEGSQPVVSTASKIPTESPDWGKQKLNAFQI